MEKAEQLLSENQSLVAMIKQCLHNHPAQRPRTGELVMKLRGEVAPGEYSSPSLPLSQYILLSLAPHGRQEANCDNSHRETIASVADPGTIISHLHNTSCV